VEVSASLKVVASVRWWLSVDDLRQMHHLGWYGLPDPMTRKTPAWFTADGLDPVRLSESDLFRSKNIEKVTEFLSVPTAICADAAQLSVYLQQRGWTWSPLPHELTASAAVAARTAHNVAFWMDPAGLLVEFENFPSLDLATGQWDASPRWPGFLLACGAPAHLYQEAGGWSRCIDTLRYVSEHLPWMEHNALTQLAQAQHQLHQEEVKAQHQRAAERQEMLRCLARRRKLVVRPEGEVQDAGEDMRTPPNLRGEVIGADEEDPREQHGDGDG
jgi:hypothetical protein